MTRNEGFKELVEQNPVNASFKTNENINSSDSTVVMVEEPASPPITTEEEQTSGFKLGWGRSIQILLCTLFKVIGRDRGFCYSQRLTLHRYTLIDQTSGIVDEWEINAIVNEHCSSYYDTKCDDRIVARI